MTVTFLSLHWVRTQDQSPVCGQGPYCEWWGGAVAPGTLLRSSFRLLAITPRRLLLSWLETRNGRAECMRGVSRTLLVCDPINVRGLEMEK